ncbi:MAG: ABC transporter substrate-binding protein [Alphaproteobacteria bacterium]
MTTLAKWTAATLAAAGLALGASGALAQGNTLQVARVIDADRYDPPRTTARSAGDIVFLIADTLVALDWDLTTLKPLLAKSWSVTPDGKTYTFNLRDDVKFCDGRGMVADDVVYSLKRWIDPDLKSPVRGRAGKVKEIRAKDKYTVEYELDEPYGELLFQLTQYFSSIVDRNSVEKLGADFGVKGFNGTGPYCWESWVPRQEFALKRNPHYTWGPDIYKNRGPAQIERMVWKIIPEDSTRLAAIQTNQVHITQYVPYIAMSQAMKAPNLKVETAQSYLWTWYIGFKVDRDLVSDLKVRQAMNLAVDREALAKNVWFGHAVPAYTPVSPDTPDFNKETLGAQLKFDPDRAKKLLDEAGWKVGADGFRHKDGKKLAPVFYGISGSPTRQMVEAVQGDLRKVGVDMQVNLFDATIAWGKLATQEFDTYAMSYPYVSVGDAYNLYFRSAAAPTPNRMNWKNPRTDELLAKGSAALTVEERRKYFDEAQMQIQQAAVWIPIIHEQLFLTATNRLDGVRAHGIYGCGIYKGLDFKWK